MNPPLEFEIDRELDLTGHARLDWPSECGPWCQERSVYRVDLRHVRAIQKIEDLDDQIELAVRLDGEGLEPSEIDRRRGGPSRRVHREREGTRGEGKCTGPVAVAPRDHIDRTARTHRQDGRYLDVTQRATPRARHAGGCAILFVPDRQIEQRPRD